MKNIKLSCIFIMILIFTLTSGCDYGVYKWKGNRLIIRGDMIISSGEELTLSPGTEVLFKNQIKYLIIPTSDQGSLIIEDGGKLTAIGTADNPVVFKEECETVHICVSQDADNDSIIEYCDFSQEETLQQIILTIGNTMTIKHSKFAIGLQFFADSEAIFENNTTNGSLSFLHVCKPQIRKNVINGCSVAFSHGSAPYISYNNITNSSVSLYGFSEIYECNPSISNNYTMNTTFLDDLSNQDPLAAEVSDAGCGW